MNKTRDLIKLAVVLNLLTMILFYTFTLHERELINAFINLNTGF